MPIRAMNQITITDLTDGVSVLLSPESVFFLIPETGEDSSTTTQVSAYSAETQVPVVVNVSEITMPSGMTVVSDDDTMSPTLTFTINDTVTTNGVVEIMTHVGDLTIMKRFNYILSTGGGEGPPGPPGPSAVTMGVGNESHTIATDHTGAVSSPVGMTTAFYAYRGDERIPVVLEILSTLPSGMTVLVNNPGTNSADGVLQIYIEQGATLNNQDTSAIVVTLTAGGIVRQYLLTWIKARSGSNGEAPILMTVESTNGVLFKNEAVSTTLVAHIYTNKVELTPAEVNALGLVRWYRDGNGTPVATGQQLVVTAGSITTRATFEGRLEG